MFGNCSKLSFVGIRLNSRRLEIIGSDALATGIEEFAFPESVHVAGNSAVGGCGSLQKIVISKCLRETRDLSFRGPRG